MKQDMISLRRRHLMIAGLAGAVAPASLFAAQCGAPRSDAPTVAEFYAGTGEETVVVSGRIVGASDCKPLAGAIVDAWSSIERSSEGDSPLRPAATTDADGRFMFTTIARAGYAGRPQHIQYRVTYRGQETPVRTLHFAPARGVAGDLVAQAQRDDAGTWRATFGLALA